jgi:hypothetical protein
MSGGKRSTPASLAPVAAVLWVVMLGYSVFMVQPSTTGTERRVLFFPELSGTGGPLRLMGEVRYLPYRADAGADLRLLVEETILGPADHRAHRLLPRASQVISTHVHGGTAYVNLSRHVWLAPTPVPSSGAERVHALAAAIRFNFPRLQEVRMLIEGQEPRWNPAGEGVADG